MHQRFGAAARYFAFNGFLALCALSAVKEIMRVSVTLAPDLHFTVDDPSRVEAFKQLEVAAARAPNVPVPRVVVAHAVPDIPVQVLAVRMDQAGVLKRSLCCRTGRVDLIASETIVPVKGGEGNFI